MVTIKEKDYILGKARTTSEKEDLKEKSECVCFTCMKDLSARLDLDINGAEGMTFRVKNYIGNKIVSHTRIYPFTLANSTNPEFLRDLNKAFEEKWFPKLKRSKWVEFWNKWHWRTGSKNSGV
jgi:hypothetical protein